MSSHALIPNLAWRDPAELRPHPLRRVLPEPDLQSPAWSSFLDGLSAAGPEGIPPIFIDPQGRVMDGGWRWRAAKLLKWDRLACLERPEEQAAALMVESLLGAKKMTRGAAVYLALYLLEDFVASAENRRLNNLRRGTKTLEKPLKVPKESNSPSGIQEICLRWGIATDTYKRALEVHKLFAADPDLKAEWEPKLLAGECNLWNIRSAAAGAEADQQSRDFGVFLATFNRLKVAAAGWSKLSGQHRAQVLQSWRDTLANLPPDFREQLQQEAA